MRIKYWLGSLKIIDYLEDLGVDGRICNGSYGKDSGEGRLDSAGSGCRPAAGFFGHGNKPSCSIKGGEFFA